MQQEKLEHFANWWDVRVHKEAGRRGEKLSTLTLAKYIGILKDFPDFVFDETMDEEDVRLWIIDKLQNWEKSTQRKLYPQIIFAVRTYLKMLEETNPRLAPKLKYIRTNVNIPYKNIIKSTSVSLKYFIEKALSKEVIRDIVTFVRKEDEVVADIVQVIYDTGSRVDESANIEKLDVNQVDRKMFIKKGKGNYPRTVTFEQSSSDAIRRLMNLSGENLFPYATETIKKKFKLYVRKYVAMKLERLDKNSMSYIKEKERMRKLFKVSIHWIRHSRATHLAVVWKDVSRLRNYMGWRSIRMADIYVSYSTDMYRYKSTDLWED